MSRRQSEPIPPALAAMILDPYQLGDAMTALARLRRLKPGRFARYGGADDPPWASQGYDDLIAAGLAGVRAAREVHRQRAGRRDTWGRAI